ncbi:hypothetical protein B0H13DRAFT_2574115 [Mycena leptocephala]|nr:hypothetical protein B0H13DRAFT_2574115 [Mycena leptocephala]
MYSLLLSGAFDVGGVFTSSVSISLTPDVTVVSFDFLRARFPSRLSQERQAQRLAFTINGGPHGSFTLELACSVSHVLATDVCMALDWKTGVRECLIGLGLPPSNVFDHLYALVLRDPGTTVPPSACARDSRSAHALYHNNIQSTQEVETDFLNVDDLSDLA